MIKDQILHAFKQLELEAPSFDVVQTDKVILVDKTRIRFDIWCYAFLGYEKMAAFVRACWEEPQKIVDEFIVAGLTQPTRHSLNAYLLYKDFIKVGIEPDNCQVGSEFITTESIVVPYANKELDDSFVMWHGYEVNGFFSKEPEVVVLPGRWKVDKVTHSSYEEDVPYEDYTETIHVLNGLADLVQTVAMSVVIVNNTVTTTPAAL